MLSAVVRETNGDEKYSNNMLESTPVPPTNPIYPQDIESNIKFVQITSTHAAQHPPVRSTALPVIGSRTPHPPAQGSSRKTLPYTTQTNRDLDQTFEHKTLLDAQPTRTPASHTIHLTYPI